MKKYLFAPLLSFASHLIPIVFIFIASVLIRYPIFFNSDHFFTADEAVMANTIMNILNGGPIVFYYDYARYFGLTGGLLAVPFMWVLGFNTMAFNLTATLLFSLYLWTLYLIARTIVPGMAFLILILALISPPFVSQMTTHNWPHIASAFLGNLIFLFFIKAKISEENKGAIIFFLFFSMGLAIYTYTFSLIYISVIALLYALAHPRWNEIRQSFSLSSLIKFFKEEKNKMQKIVRFLDILILLFFIVIIFSYVFGGFGIDIGGISVFQVNNLHKPVIQLLVILFLRILIYRKDLISNLYSIKNFISKKIPSNLKKIIWLGSAGFLIGLSPRILSILTGETSRGGQGFDVDFNPIKLIAHLWEIIVGTLPKLFSLDNPFLVFSFDSIDNFESLLGILEVQLLLLLLFSVFSFFSDTRESLKNILTLKAMRFNPLNIYIVLPLLTCLANVIVQNGSEPRYLFPIFGTIVIWLAILVDKFQRKLKGLLALVLVVWVGFYSIKTYKSYEDQGIVDSFELVKLERIDTYNLIEFLSSKNIEVAYSNYQVSQIGTFLSGGKINISEYSDNPIAKSQKRRSLNSSNFAIIAQNESVPIYQNFLLQNKIRFKVHKVAGYEIYWDFSGEQTKINVLRSLIT